MSVNSKDVLDFGEDGEWLAAPGHHDLAEFIAAADDHCREEWGASDDDLPSQWPNEPKHTYYRPVELADCRKEVARSYPDRVPPAQLRIAESLFEDRREEGWVYPCEADHVGAELWTEVRA